MPVASDATLLFVCVANVCRSPFLEFSVGHELANEVPELALTVRSAGVNVDPGQELCDFTADSIRAVAGNDDFISGFSSRQLTASEVGAAHLILTATRDQRAAIARMAPDARARTFTMLEATKLAHHLVQARRSYGEPLPAELSLLAQELNGQRGLMPQAERRVSRWRAPRDRSADLDILDVHTGQARKHSGIQHLMRRASTHFASSLLSLTRA